MKTLILYATKYGAAREIAERIAKLIDGAETCDLKQADTPPLKQYDCVIIGSSLYAGAIRKEAKLFLNQNAAVLKNKKTGLFVSGMAESGEHKFFSDNFPAELVESAKAANLLGGIFDPEKAGGFERFIMKIITKTSGYINNINDEKIAEFAEIMQS
jgi:menaquinone-dependent protoporphyrinogen oxidase